MTKKDKNVLIVENEIIVADDICRVIADMGYSTLPPAFGFNDATHIFTEFLPDLIILDIRLRGRQSGIDFASWLRKKYETPIIYLTVYDDQMTRRSIESTYPVAYIQKPFTETELKNAVEKALN